MRLRVLLASIIVACGATLTVSIAGANSSPGPGSLATPSQASSAKPQWREGALEVLDRLDEALARVQHAGVGRATLTRDSYLYEAVLGYAYLRWCPEDLRRLGEPPPKWRPARTALERICARTAHAAALFARAVQSQSTRTLANAAREATKQIVPISYVRASLVSGKA